MAKSMTGISSSAVASTSAQLGTKLGWWLLFTVIAVFWFLHSQGYTEDDAFIHLVYARNVHNGFGFLFNDQVSNGDTSPLWVLILSLGGYFTSDWILIGKFCSASGVLFFALSYYRFASSLDFGRDPIASHLPGILLVLFAINPYFVYWSYAGMEAIFAAGWLMLTCMSLAKPRQTNLDLMISALLLGCAPLIRPEMVLLLAIGASYLLWTMIIEVKKNQRRIQWLPLLITLVLMLLPLALWSAYAIDTFGYVLPNTNAAKRAAPGDSVVVRLIQIYGVGFPGILIGCFWLLTTASVQFLKNEKRQPYLAKLARLIEGQPGYIVPFIVNFCLVTVFYITNHTYVQTRYIIVLAPGMLAILLALMWKRGRKVEKFLTLGVSAIIAMYISVFLAYPLISNKVRSDTGTAQVADYINHAIPLNSKIGIFSIGEYGYLIRQHIVDIGGITQPEAAPFLNSPKDMLQWAKSKGAEYYVALDSPEEGASMVFEVETVPVGWSFAPGFYNKKEYFRVWKLASDSQH
jgi:hypothetical protein